MLLCHFKFSFKEDKLNFRFIGTLKQVYVTMGQSALKHDHDDTFRFPLQAGVCKSMLQ